MKKSVLWTVIVLLTLSLLFVACKSQKEPDNPTGNDETTESTEVTTQSPCAKNGHVFGVWYTATAPTCTETGMERHDCENCDYYEQQRVAATGHTEVIDEAVPNTCTTTGLTEGKHCSVCNEVFVTQEVIAALGGHEWTEATCTTPKTCTTCGTTEGEVGGHDMMDSVCSVCNHSDCFEFTLLDDGTYSVKAKSSPKFPAELVFPTTYLGKTVSTIESYGFPNCEGVTSITVPDSVKSIGYHAFSHCDDLTSITLPFLGNPVDGSNCEHLGYLFGTRYPDITEQSTPKSLKTVIITGGDSIGQYAFLKCSNLTSITLPDSVTSIGYYAFGGCKSLTDISLGSNVTSIGNYAFYGCNGLTSFSIPDSVTDIGPYAFADCQNLTSITVPDSVTIIGTFAFAGCIKLTSITIPGSVTSLGDSAFEYCTELIEIENGVSYAGKWVIDCDPTVTLVTLRPNTIGIGNFAFKDCSSLTSVIFGDNISSIGTSAFDGCTGLTSIAIPNSVKSIGSRAFNDCTGLTSIMLGKNVTYIGTYAFIHTGITSITIPSSVTAMGSGVFIGCKNLKSVTFENTTGWFYTSTLMETSGMNISAIDLANPVTAAEYLLSTYRAYCWQRN